MFENQREKMYQMHKKQQQQIIIWAGKKIQWFFQQTRYIERQRNFAKCSGPGELEALWKRQTRLIPNWFVFVRSNSFLRDAVPIQYVRKRCAVRLFCDNRMNGDFSSDYKRNTFYISHSNNMLVLFLFRLFLGHAMCACISRIFYISRIVHTFASMALAPNHNQQKCR